VIWDDEELTARLVSQKIKDAVLEKNTLLKEMLPDLRKEAAKEWRHEQYLKSKQSSAFKTQTEKAREYRHEQYLRMKALKRKGKDGDKG